jgi:branched-chain amino acid transport system permease protein
VTKFLQLLTNGVLVGLLYSLVALGFVLIRKGSGVINFAQGELVLVAGYVVAWLLTDLDLPVVAAVLGTIVVMVALGLGVERLVLRPLENESLLSLVMATIALGIIMRGAVPLLWGDQVQDNREVFTGRALELGSVRIEPVNFWATVVVVIFLVAFGWFFTRSRLGLAMQAVSDDRLAAQSLGCDVRRINAAAWAVAGAVSAFAGFIWSQIIGVNGGLLVVGLFVFPVVILGGLESISGAVIAGLVVGALESFTTGYLNTSMPGFGPVAPLVLLLVVLMFRPHGLFGRPDIDRV